MRAEIAAIHSALNLAHTMLNGMTHTLNQAFGKPNVTEEYARQLQAAAKKLEI